MVDRPNDRRIDPLIKSPSEQKQVAENWHDDPWDIVEGSFNGSLDGSHGEERDYASRRLPFAGREI